MGRGQRVTDTSEDAGAGPGQDALGAFMPGPPVERAGRQGGPLAGLSFAVKDIFDVAGTVTGCGNPDWAASHQPAEADAPVVAALLDAGAHLFGKTITDELAFSLNGQNFHFGSPANPNAPGRIAGGSSCGSASAVAGGIVDFALGSDTAGSVRIPASYCGIFGIRTTHGRVPLHGVMPLAPSYDTVGWFARDAETLGRVGSVLLGESPGAAAAPSRLLVAQDAFAQVDAGVRERLQPWVDRLSARFGGAEPIELGEPGGLESWMRKGRLIQACEVWRAHGAWIEKTRPRFGPEIQERFDWVRSVDPEENAALAGERADYAARLHDLLGDRGIICLPAAPDIAPRLDAGAEALRIHRGQVWCLTCPATLAGLPQITIPATSRQGAPLGLGLIGPAGSDMALIALAEALTASAESAVYPPL